MIKVETTTISKFASLEEANQAISWFMEQGLPTQDLHIYTVCAKSERGKHLELIAGIGGALGLLLGVSSLSDLQPSSLMLFASLLITILGGTYVYQQISKNKQNDQSSSNGTDYLLKANSVEEAQAFQAMLNQFSTSLSRA